MSLVTATIVLSIPDDVHVGDRFTVYGDAIVVAIRDELLDATPHGGPRSYAAGERSFELLIPDARIRRR